MARKRVYSLFDRRVREFGNLLLGQNDEALKRELQFLTGGNSLLSKYPQDFDVMLLGEFELETGELSIAAPLLVCSLSDILGPGEAAQTTIFPEGD